MRRLFLVLSFFVAASVVVAGSLYVDDNGPGDPQAGNPLVSDPAEDGSQAHPFDAIQEAIDAAVNSDEVIIRPGTYTGDGNRDIDFMGKAIVVTGSDPNDPDTVAATVIDCQGTEAQPHRGFYFHTNETESSVLKGLTITNGYGAEENILQGRYSGGGGILCVGASPRLVSLLITSSRAEFGGAILATQAPAHLEKCRLASNTAFAIGGGFYLFECTSFDIVNCTISKNNASMSAGGGAVYYLSRGTIHNTIFSENTADSGGALSVFQSEITLEDSIIRANVADSMGGGIYLKYSPWGVEFRNCLFSGNYSKSNGGGLYVLGSGPVISECTIVGNRAEENGGGISGSAWADITVRNSIFHQDTARLGGDHIALVPEEPGEYDGTTLSVRYSVYGSGLTPTNMNVDPLFAAPGHWDDNGTPNDWSDDTWIEGDYHLKSYAGRWDPVGESWATDSEHSPCIDAGDPTSDFTAEPAYNGGRINIGAYGGTEYASRTGYCPEHPAGDLDGDCRVTFADLAIMAAHWQECNLDPPIACE